jgi:hypothetical protein
MVVDRLSGEIVSRQHFRGIERGWIQRSRGWFRYWRGIARVVLTCHLRRSGYVGEEPFGRFGPETEKLELASRRKMA